MLLVKAGPRLLPGVGPAIAPAAAVSEEALLSELEPASSAEVDVLLVPDRARGEPSNEFSRELPGRVLLPVVLPKRCCLLEERGEVGGIGEPFHVDDGAPEFEGVVDLPPPSDPSEENRVRLLIPARRGAPPSSAGSST